MSQKQKRKSSTKSTSGGSTFSDAAPKQDAQAQVTASPLDSTKPTRFIPEGRGHLILLFFVITIGSILVWSWFQRDTKLDEYGYELVAQYPHDTNSFTQGLYYRNGHLFESTGQFGNSRIRKVEMKTGKVVKNHDLDEDWFGEGCTAVGDKLVQLTWQNKIGIVYDFDLNEINKFDIDGEGWGLTFDGKWLIMSDGTSTITFLDPETYKPLREITVRKGASRLSRINELEYINGYIYANVWYEDVIYQISPENGDVVGRINLRGLYPHDRRTSREAVLNGIAINPETGNLIVTGKNWPNVFEIKPVPLK